MVDKLASREGLDFLSSILSNKFWLEEEIDNFLVKAPHDFRSAGFHASSAGMCPRFLQLQMLNTISKEKNAKLERIFDNGKATHHRYHRYFKGAGILERDEVPIKLEFDGFVVVGSCDFVVKNRQGELFVLELKTINNKGYEELFNSGYKINNFKQWNIYSKGTGIPKGVIIYENKDNQDIKTFPVEFDQTIYDETIGDFRLIAECNRLNIIVPKPAKCPDSSWCKAKSYCKE